MIHEDPGGILWSTDDYAKDKVLAIGFANTVSWRGKAEPTDYLPDPNSWMEWLRENAALPSESLEALFSRSAEEQGLAFRRSIAFREAIYNLLCAVCRRDSPSPSDRMLLQEVLGRAMSRLTFHSAEKGWEFELQTQPPDWELTLYGVALSTAQLLTSPALRDLRVCDRPECLWLFLDHTKNHSRRWCSMQTCGNVIKARTNYAKKAKKAD